MQGRETSNEGAANCTRLFLIFIVTPGGKCYDPHLMGLKLNLEDLLTS